MTQRAAFGWVNLGILAVWSVHNAVLRPWEAARVPAELLEPVLLVARVAVWLAPIAVYLRRFGLPAGEALAVTTPIRPGPAAAGALSGALYLGLVGVLVGPPSAPPSIAAGAVWLGGVVLEELWMRGFVFGGLARGWGPGVALVGSTALFAAMHLPGWVGEGLPATEIAPSLVVVGLLGLVTGIARWSSGSIWPAVAIHAANNLFGG